MASITRLFFLLILSTSLVSCGFSSAGPQQNTPPATHPTSSSSTPKPLVKSTVTPSVTPTVPTATPSQANKPVCIVSNSTAPSGGWDCINESYGFTVHFPPTAGIARTINDVVEVWLENHPSDPPIERRISIALGETAESCFSSDAEKIQIGEHNFMVNNGFEPSGVVYAWKSYATKKESKSVCFFFSVGYMTWNQDTPLFPPEKDQGLDDVEAVLATFRWLNP
jgi:hypothetical protein